MAKGVYVGVDGVARRVKTMYVGVNGVARKIKTGYIGINGIARKFFGFVPFEFYAKAGELEPAPQATHPMDRTNAAAITFGDYSLWAGGGSGASKDPFTRVIDVIDRSFTKLPNLNLSRPKNYLGAAVVGNYVIFPGGTYDQNGARGASNDLDVYDRSLTKVNTNPLSLHFTESFGRTLGENAFFRIVETSSLLTVSSSLTAKITAAANRAYGYPAGDIVGNSIVFATANSYVATEVVRINASGTTTKFGAFTNGTRYGFGGASVGDKVFFAGGSEANGQVGTVTAYDESGTQYASLAELRHVGTYIGGARTDSNAIFVGGYNRPYIEWLNLSGTYEGSATLKGSSSYPCAETILGDYLLVQDQYTAVNAYVLPE